MSQTTLIKITSYYSINKQYLLFLVVKNLLQLNRILNIFICNIKYLRITIFTKNNKLFTSHSIEHIIVSIIIKNLKIYISEIKMSAKIYHNLQSPI